MACLNLLPTRAQLTCSMLTASFSWSISRSLLNGHVQHDDVAQQSTAEGELLATGKTHDDYSYPCVLIDFPPCVLCTCSFYHSRPVICDVKTESRLHHCFLIILMAILLRSCMHKWEMPQLLAMVQP